MLVVSLVIGGLLFAHQSSSLGLGGGHSAQDSRPVQDALNAAASLTAAQADRILRDISRNERAPRTPLEEFFVMSKQATIRGYYTSEIGIHQELRYKGNQMIPEFVGCQTEDGKDCPHCGQEAGGRRQEVGGRR
jgi:hypothetical protein